MEIDLSDVSNYPAETAETNARINALMTSRKLELADIDSDRKLTKKSIGQGNLNIIAIQAMIVTIVAIANDTITPNRAVILALSIVNVVLQFIIFVLIVTQANMTSEYNKRLHTTATNLSTIVTSISGLSLIITTAVNAISGYAGLNGPLTVANLTA